MKTDELQQLIEKVQRAHWDLAACQCWFCREARELGCRPRGDYDRTNYPVRHDAFDTSLAAPPTGLVPGVIKVIRRLVDRLFER